MTGTNMLSFEQTKFICNQVNKVEFSNEETWFKARNWRKLSQNEYLDMLPINVGKTGFIQYQAGFIKGYLPTDFPVMTPSYMNDNPISEVLAYSLLLLISGDLGNAYSSFQVWLFMMNRFKYVETEKLDLDALIPNRQIVEIGF